MENLTITKTPKGKEFLYEVFADGVKIGQRKTARVYVAAAVYLPGHEIKNREGKVWRVVEKIGVASWIGRQDLIAGNVDVKEGAKVARLVTI
jgi:hypothetical protein